MIPPDLTVLWSLQVISDLQDVPEEAVSDGVSEAIGGDLAHAGGLLGAESSHIDEDSGEGSSGMEADEGQSDDHQRCIQVLYFSSVLSHEESCVSIHAQLLTASVLGTCWESLVDYWMRYH